MFTIIKGQTPKLPEMSDEDITRLIEWHPNLIADFTRFIFLDEDMIGLASNQVGMKLRMIAVKTNEEILIMINPKVVKSSLAQVSREEGCFSFPDTMLGTTAKGRKAIFNSCVILGCIGICAVILIIYKMLGGE